MVAISNKIEIGDLKQEVVRKSKRAVNVIQRSKEWFELRKGRFTSSEIHRLVSVPKAKKDREKTLSVGAMSYVLDKVAELHYDTLLENFDSEATDWGEMYEDEAREAYELYTGTVVEEVGFYTYGTHSGASTDGVVGDFGVIEIKCPKKRQEHLKNVRLKTAADFKALHKNYYWQIQCELLCSGREWCDFVSYDPRLKGRKTELKTLRIYRNEEDLKWLRNRIKLAVAERDFQLFELAA